MYIFGESSIRELSAIAARYPGPLQAESLARALEELRELIPGTRYNGLGYAVTVQEIGYHGDTPKISDFFVRFCTLCEGETTTLSLASFLELYHPFAPDLI